MNAGVVSTVCGLPAGVVVSAYEWANCEAPAPHSLASDAAPVRRVAVFQGNVASAVSESATPAQAHVVSAVVTREHARMSTARAARVTRERAVTPNAIAPVNDLAIQAAVGPGRAWSADVVSSARASARELSVAAIPVLATTSMVPVVLEAGTPEQDRGGAIVAGCRASCAPGCRVGSRPVGGRGRRRFLAGWVGSGRCGGCIRRYRTGPSE